MNEIKTVQTTIGKIEVKALKFGQYAVLLTSLSGLPKKVASFADQGNDRLFESIPEIVANFLPEVTKILSQSTVLSTEDIEEKLILIDVIRLSEAVIEVNRLNEVFLAIKGFGKLMTPQKALKNGTTE